jgi:hypothetical protein
MCAELTMSRLNAEGARIVHTLCDGEASNSGGDAKEVLRALHELRESLYGIVEYSRQLFPVAERLVHTGAKHSRCHSLSVFVRTG